MSSLSTLNPVTCSLSPAKGANGTHSNPSKVTTVHRQTLPLLQVKKEVKGKEKVLPKEASRREMIQLTAATLGLYLLSPASAEARTKNPTMKQRFFDKYEELRRKAGLSKPKDEDVYKKPKTDDNKPKTKSETKENKSKPNTEAGEKRAELKDGAEKKPSTATQKFEIVPKGELSIPVLPHILNGNTIETTLP